MNNAKRAMKSLNSRTDGAAMIYAVFIMAVITATCTLIISLNFYRNFANKEILNVHRCRINADNGIQLMLAEPGFPEYDTTIMLSLFTTANDSISLRREQWGLYDLLISGAKHRNTDECRMALAGSLIKDDDLMALQLGSSTVPLTVAGNTVIRGKAQVPGGTVNIAGGEIFSGSISGCDIGESVGIIIPDAWWNRISTEHILEMMIGQLSQGAIYNIRSNISNSFSDRVKVFYEQQGILIGNISLTGKIAVISSKQIIVSRDAQLKDVLLIAPAIAVESGFSGSLQAIATDSVVTGTDCEFRYPSTLSIYSENRDDRGAKVVLGNGSILNGIALCMSGNSTVNHSFMIHLKSGSTVNGQVICNDMVQAEGTVNGTLITRRTLAISGAGISENVLRNTVIDVTALPAGYCGIDIFTKPGIQKIIKCVH